MIFWITFVLLAFIAIVAVLWPLTKPRDAAAGRKAAAMAIYRDQLAEVDRDLARAVIGPEEAEAARVEIKRRMLAADKADDAEDKKDDGRLVLVGAALAVPILGAILYAEIGQPGMPSLPFAEREAERDGDDELSKLVAELKRRLAEDPNGGDARGWELLGTTQLNRGRFDEAVAAFGVLVAREDAVASDWSQYAEALVARERGVVTPPASEAIAKTLELEPGHPAGIYYRAREIAQAGQPADARKLLLERIANEGAAQPWMPSLLDEANRLGQGLGLEPVGLPSFAPSRPGPSAEDVEAAGEMNEEDRAAFIRSMVDRLAERLEEEPDDLEGWLRLAQARIVLKEPDAARAALAEIERLVEPLADDAPERAALANLRAALGG